MTIARYDVNSANTNRHVKFTVIRDAGATAATFLSLKGEANQYPFYGQIQSPTLEQELEQLRLSLVVRALSVYTPPVEVAISANGDTLSWVAEADEFGAYFSQAWTTSQAGAKHLVTDIVDVLGTGGMSSPKTKDGLQTLVDNLSTVSFDGGTTGPFGALSAGAITLPDGRSVAAPTVSLPATTNPAGLTVAFVLFS